LEILVIYHTEIQNSLTF